MKRYQNWRDCQDVKCDIIYAMSGHSKWHNIRRKKEAEDAKKSKIFSKMSRAIMVAARQGGEDPGKNSALRLAIDKAKEVRTPKENIERAISKGLGIADGLGYEEAVYEGYGPEGVAFMVKTLTDNNKRTVAEIRFIFEKSGGSLGAAGSTAYVFGADPKNPNFTVPITSKNTAEKLIRLIEELEDNDDVQAVYANYEFRGEVGGLE